MVFHWSLEWQQVSSSLQDSSLFMADLSNVVVWSVSTRPFIFKSTSPFINPLVTVPRAVIIGKNVIFMFHSFSVPYKVEVFIFIFIFF